jgi:uncharacterized protein YdaU (DUF1376 family)
VASRAKRIFHIPRNFPIERKVSLRLRPKVAVPGEGRLRRARKNPRLLDHGAAVDRMAGAMKRLPYYKMYPADCDADEHFRLMTFEQRGLYWTLLNHAWLNDGLPTAIDDIRDLCRLHQTDFERMWERVSKCFEIVDGRFRNRRQEKERAEVRSKSEQSADAARKMHARKSSVHASAERPQDSRMADAVPRAYESVSEPDSEDFSKSENQEVAVVDRQLEELLFLFAALGRGMTVADRMRCENEWKALELPDRIAAARHARASLTEWQTRPTEKIAQPWNYLRERHWERAAPRLLAQSRPPTRSEEAHERAANAFREGA